MDDDQLWMTLREAVAREEIDAAVRDIYARTAAAIAERGPTCWQSGNCCNFEAYGHRLYVTAVEIAWFLRQVAAADRREDAQRVEGAAALPVLGQAVRPRLDALTIEPRGRCPFQVANLCTAHAMRPLGCRLFFCEKGTEAWQHEAYERFMADFRSLHERYSLPYRYMEWRTGLAEALA